MIGSNDGLPGLMHPCHLVYILYYKIMNAPSCAFDPAMSMKGTHVANVSHSLGSLEHDLASVPRGRWTNHVPRWRVKAEGAIGDWILDGDLPVAFIHRGYRFIDFLCASPDRFRAPGLPEVYHAPTLLGIRLPLDLWLDWNHSRECYRPDLRLILDQSSCSFVIEEKWPELEMESQRHFQIRLDQDWGYVCDLRTEVTGTQVRPLEFANLLPAGAADARPDHQRHDRILWRHPTRGILRWIQNMALLRSAGNREVADRRQLAVDGWIAFAGERERNPVLAFRSASPCVASGTCSALLDEHVHFHGEPTRGGDGCFHWSMDATLLALDGQDLASLDCQAQDNDLLLDHVPRDGGQGPFHFPFCYDPQSPYNPRMHPFVYGGWRDFSQPILPGRHFRGAFWPAPEGHAGWASVQPVADADGGKALVLRGLAAGEIPSRVTDPIDSLGPARNAAADRILVHDGTPLWQDAGSRVRVAVLTRARGEAGATLCLRVRMVLFSQEDPAAQHEVILHAGQASTWTLLAIEANVPPAHDHAVYTALAITGDACWEICRIYFGPAATASTP